MQRQRAYSPVYAPGASTLSIEWMTPFEHSTSHGQFCDFDGPADLLPTMAATALDVIGSAGWRHAFKRKPRARGRGSGVRMMAFLAEVK